MITKPLPGTLVQTGANLYSEPIAPVRYGRVLGFINSIVQVQWDDGTTTYILGECLEPDEPK